MSKKPFQPGDRVKVYGFSERGERLFDGEKGRVTKVDGYIVRLEFDDKSEENEKGGG